MAVLPLLLACAAVTEDPDAVACPAYSGLLAEGRRWEWASTDTTGARWTAELATLSPEVTVVRSDGWTETWSCDGDGLHLHARRLDDGATWREYAYDPPVRVLPATLAVGVAWTAHAAWRYTDADGAEETASSSTQYAVTAEESMAVPAGTWTALRVEGSTGGKTTAHWRAADVGAVRDDTAELVGYDP